MTMQIVQNEDSTISFRNAATASEVRIGVADVTLTSAQIKALNATPQTIISAPGTNLAIAFYGAAFYLPFNTTGYATPAAGADLVFKYTNGSGAQASPQLESTGFINATSNQIRWLSAAAAGAIGAVGDITPVANAALVLQNLSTEYTTGDSTLKVRVFYRIIPTVW